MVNDMTLEELIEEARKRDAKMANNDVSGGEK
jgi:hypothetical protein